MNQPIKTIVLFLAILSITSVSFAQQNGDETTESVIVLTKARLDSLLTDIANSKRALLAQREQERLANLKLESQISAMPDSQKQLSSQTAPDQEEPRNAVGNDGRIYQELDRMDQRIDRLMMELSQTSSQTTGRPPTVVYEQGRSGAPNRSQPTENDRARVQDALSAEIKNLQDKIETLQTEIINLEQTPDTAKRDEISSLKERLKTLTAELEEANRVIEYGKQQGITNRTYGNNSLVAILKNYRQIIYFDHNSANLDSGVKPLLLQLAQMIKRSDENVVVLIQGYASKTGSALYNYKLSQKRANAVKDVLTNYGISAGNIEIIGHGVSKSNDVPAARRAEISLLMN